MKNKQNYWEFMYSGLKPLFRTLVVMTLVFLMMIGFLGLFHKFIISQPLLGPNYLFSDLHQTYTYLGCFYFMVNKSKFAAQSAVDTSNCTSHLPIYYVPCL